MPPLPACFPPHPHRQGDYSVFWLLNSSTVVSALRVGLGLCRPWPRAQRRWTCPPIVVFQQVHGCCWERESTREEGPGFPPIVSAFSSENEVGGAQFFCQGTISLSRQANVEFALVSGRQPALFVYRGCVDKSTVQARFPFCPHTSRDTWHQPHEDAAGQH